MFLSDNNSGVHPKIMKAIINENKGHAYPYGEDSTSEKAKKAIRKLLGKDADVFFVTTGTAANIIGLSGLLKPYEGVVAAKTAHINVDECGALERFSGSKIIEVPSKNGKISKEDIYEALNAKGVRHQSQPRVISISQTSELGSLYSVEEIKDLADFAHENDMYLHVDGARISNAIIALDSSFKEMISDTGVDLFTFGGTKNGMMVGEAIVSLNQDLSKAYKYTVKQGMQLLSKMRFVSAQFLAYIEEDIWKESAKNANEMGKYFAEELSKFPQVKLQSEPKTNMVFLYLNKELIKALEKEFDFYVEDEETSLIRLVTSFDTSKEDVDKFINIIEKELR